MGEMGDFSRFPCYGEISDNSLRVDTTSEKGFSATLVVREPHPASATEGARSGRA